MTAAPAPMPRIAISGMTRMQIARFAAPLMGAFLVFTVLQPFLPSPFGSLMIMLRFVIVPAFAAMLVYGWTDRTIFATVAAFLLLRQYAVVGGLDVESIQILLSLLAVLPLFKAGMVLRGMEEGKPVFRALLVGGLVLNVLTMGIVFDALQGGAMAALVMETVLRDLNEPIFRFAIGSPIEVPALITLATIAGVFALRLERLPYTSIALAMNLAAAIASQSRIVLVMSTLIFLRSLPRFGWSARVAFVGLLVGALVSQGEVLATTRESIFARFGGEDFGSTDDRFRIVNVLMDQCNTACLTFGNGITSSMDAMQNAGLGRRTMENVALQLVYEIGALGIIIFGALLVRSMFQVRRGFRLSFELIFIGVQTIVTLPITAFAPYFAFCAGAVWADREMR